MKYAVLTIALCTAACGAAPSASEPAAPQVAKSTAQPAAAEAGADQGGSPEVVDKLAQSSQSSDAKNVSETTESDEAEVQLPIVAPQISPETQIAVVNQPEQLVDVSALLVNGKVTVVDFFADWCAPCKVLDKNLATAIEGENRVIVRKIDVTVIPEQATVHYGIDQLPHVRIYGPDGRLVHDLIGPDAEKTPDLVRDAVRQL